MKKAIIVVLALAMLLPVALSSCSGGKDPEETRMELLNDLYNVRKKVKTRSTLIIDYWNSEKEFYVKELETADPFDIAGIAEKTVLDETKVREHIKANYDNNGEYDVDTDYRSVNMFRNKVFSEFYDGRKALDHLEAMALFYDYAVSDIHVMQESYTTTMYNFYMIKYLFTSLDCKNEIANELSALKTKVDAAHTEGAVSDGLYTQYTAAISDLKKLDALEYTILDFCTDNNNATDVYTSKESYQADVEKAIETVDTDVAQIEKLA